MLWATPAQMLLCRPLMSRTSYQFTVPLSCSMPQERAGDGHGDIKALLRLLLLPERTEQGI